MQAPMLWTISACTVPPPSPPSTAPVCAGVIKFTERCRLQCARSYNSLQFDAIDCTAWASPAPNLTHWEPSKTAPLLSPWAECSTPLLSPDLTVTPTELQFAAQRDLTPPQPTPWPLSGDLHAGQIVSILHLFWVRIGDPPPVHHFLSSLGTCWFDGSSHFGTFFGRDGPF